MKMIIFLLGILITLQHGDAQTDSTTVDSLLIKQLESQMTSATITAPPQARGTLSTNPNMSVIGDFQGSYRSRVSRSYQLNLNEVEVSLQSVVDPYARADFFISFAPNPESGEFGADMKLHLVNDGPVTIPLTLRA